MSGIAGIVRFDGVPVDERLLRRMSQAMAVRGPDGQQTWTDGTAGFGYALLRTNAGRTAGQQPSSLDGQVWIVADARIDAREELVRKLRAHRIHTREEAADAELILHAYAAWGARAVDHLIGDFAFAIWDRRTRRLFCARDHFGIKPFYYAEVPAGIVFSNTLDCVRMHPDVGDELNQIAVADFLLFGLNREPATTTFADIRRLVAGHTLTCDDRRRETVPYWTVPVDGRIRYRCSRDYVEHFKDLLTMAVADRLPPERVDVWMSGGLDSTSIAAIARDVQAERDGRVDLHAHTVVYDRLIPSDERYYAGLAAGALGVGISFFAADDYTPFQGWDDDVRTPEPTSDPFVLMRLRQLRSIAASNRVVLCGEGGDEIFWRSDLVDLIGRMEWRELATDIARSLAVYRVRPAVGVGDLLRKWRGPARHSFTYPAWLNGSFVRRSDVRRHFGRVCAEMTESHPLRGEAHRRLVTAPWGAYFESLDPGTTGVPVEIRYPFMDVRLVNYLLAIPPIPWFVAKTLLRETMKGTLPAQVLRRRKTPLQEDPLRAHLTSPPENVREPLRPLPALADCIDHAAVPRLDGRHHEDPWLDVRPYCLNHWLARLHA